MHYAHLQNANTSTLDQLCSVRMSCRQSSLHIRQEYPQVVPCVYGLPTPCFLSPTWTTVAKHACDVLLVRYWNQCLED